MLPGSRGETRYSRRYVHSLLRDFERFALTRPVVLATAEMMQFLAPTAETANHLMLKRLADRRRYESPARKAIRAFRPMPHNFFTGVPQEL